MPWLRRASPAVLFRAWPARLRAAGSCVAALTCTPISVNPAGYEPGSVFEGKLLADRVDTVWGTISLVTAERMLLEEALKDPSNKQVVAGLVHGFLHQWCKFAGGRAEGPVQNKQARVARVAWLTSAS